jgi:DNA-binding GntR family transcriptional regulator
VPQRRASQTRLPGQPASHALQETSAVPVPTEDGAGLPSIGKHKTLEVLAYQDIRQAISEGRYVPGQRIVVSALAAASGVSRIPVLQALRRLETEGFVRITPHKDVIVAKLSPEEFRERFVLLATLEALCLREAAERITPDVLVRLRGLQASIVTAKRQENTAQAASADLEFHRTLWRLAPLSHTLRILQNLWDRGGYYRLVMHGRRGGFMQESLVEHERLLKALEAHKPLKASRISEEHHLESMRRLLEVIEHAG